MKKILKSKLFLVIGVVILIFASINFVRSWKQNRVINQEINDLEQEIYSLEKNNLQLSELIKYLNSTAYIEERARTALGLKKEGEKTIIIPDLQINATSEFSFASADKKAKTISNPKKWWQYFFAKK